MQMNYKVAGQFEPMYPITLGGNVKLNGGQTLEQWKAYVEDLLNNIDGGHTEIWTGNHILGVTGAGITLSQSINNSRNGWILVFKPSNSSANYNYCHVPKVHPSGYGVKFIVGGTEGAIYSKFVIINGNKIDGHSSNNTNGNQIMELVRVLAY